MTPENQDKHDGHEGFNLDDVQLHTDADIKSHRAAPPKKEPKKARRPVRSGSGSGFTAVLAVLCLILTATGGWLYYRYTELDNAFERLLNEKDQLIDQKESTSADLNLTATSLKDAQVSISTLNTALQKAEKTVAGQAGEIKALKNDLNKSQASLDKALKEGGDLKKSLAAVEKALADEKDKSKRLASDKASLEKELADFKVESKAALDKLNTSHQETVAKLNTQVEKAKAEKDQSIKEQREIERERDQLKKRFEEESAASLSLVQERSRLEEDKRKLQNQVAQLETSLTAKNKRIKQLEEVEIGELVPYSGSVTPGAVSYREPMPEGLKVPKRLGHVTVQVLVTETGRVEQAFIVPGQDSIDAALSTALIRTILKWKFSPPTLDGIRVKTWQTVLVFPE